MDIKPALPKENRRVKPVSTDIPSTGDDVDAHHDDNALQIGIDTQCAAHGAVDTVK